MYNQQDDIGYLAFNFAILDKTIVNMEEVIIWIIHLIKVEFACLQTVWLKDIFILIS